MFGQLVLARIESTSKLDSLRVLSEAGVPAGRRARLEVLVRLVPDQHGVSSPTATAFQLRAGALHGIAPPS